MDSCNYKKRKLLYLQKHSVNKIYIIKGILIGGILGVTIPWVFNYSSTSITFSNFVPASIRVLFCASICGLFGHVIGKGLKIMER